MSTPRLDFWFDFGSTYSYPAAERIRPLAEAAAISRASAPISICRSSNRILFRKTACLLRALRSPPSITIGWGTIASRSFARRSH